MTSPMACGRSPNWTGPIAHVDVNSEHKTKDIRNETKEKATKPDGGVGRCWVHQLSWPRSERSEKGSGDVTTLPLCPLLPLVADSETFQVIRWDEYE